MLVVATTYNNAHVTGRACLIYRWSFCFCVYTSDDRRWWRMIASQCGHEKTQQTTINTGLERQWERYIATVSGPDSGGPKFLVNRNHVRLEFRLMNGSSYKVKPAHKFQIIRYIYCSLLYTWLSTIWWSIGIIYNIRYVLKTKISS